MLLLGCLDPLQSQPKSTLIPFSSALKFPLSMLWDLNTKQFLASQSYWEMCLLHRNTAALPDLRELDISHQKSFFFPHKEIGIRAPHFLFDTWHMLACVCCQSHIPNLPLPLASTSHISGSKAQSLTSAPHVLVTLFQSRSWGFSLPDEAQGSSPSLPDQTILADELYTNFQQD